MNIENEAGLFYEKAAEIFGDDKDLFDLLTQLADDEKIHYELVKKAFEMVDYKNEALTGISIDDETKRKIEDMLFQAKEKLLSGKMTKNELIAVIVQVEFTETNEIFLYVISLLKLTVKVIFNSTQNIEQHKSRIKEFVQNRPEFSNVIPAIERIPAIKREPVLIIEDNETMVEAFEIFLSDISEVENVSSLPEAVRKVEENDYTAIIVDVKSKFVNGMELYKEIVAIRPNLTEKFLFLVDNECTYLNFFDKLNIKCLEKPVSLKEVKHAINELV